jgi:hypothetical protein
VKYHEIRTSLSNALESTWLTSRAVCYSGARWFRVRSSVGQRKRYAKYLRSNICKPLILHLFITSQIISEISNSAASAFGMWADSIRAEEDLFNISTETVDEVYSVFSSCLSAY